MFVARATNTTLTAYLKSKSDRVESLATHKWFTHHICLLVDEIGYTRENDKRIECGV